MGLKKSSRFPWKNATVAAAVVVAVAGTIQAVITTSPKWFEGNDDEAGKGPKSADVTLQTPSPSNADRAEYIAILDDRAERAKVLLKGKPELQARFEELHRRNLEAINSNQLILSHEITNQIDALLWEALPSVPFQTMYQDRDIRLSMTKAEQEARKKKVDEMLDEIADEFRK